MFNTKKQHRLIQQNYRNIIHNEITNTRITK